jgi:hypothetical protein
MNLVTGNNRQLIKHMQDLVLSKVFQSVKWISIEKVSKLFQRFNLSAAKQQLRDAGYRCNKTIRMKSKSIGHRQMMPSLLSEDRSTIEPNTLTVCRTNPICLKNQIQVLLDKVVNLCMK